MTSSSKDPLAISGIWSRAIAQVLAQNSLSFQASDWRVPSAEAALTDARHRAASVSTLDHLPNREAELTQNWSEAL